jgi:hypothetical protein
MLMMPQKKKIATLIMGSKKPDFVQGLGDSSGDTKMVDPNEPEKDNSVALESAMQDFSQALKGEDVKAMVSAFRSLLDIADEPEMDQEEGQE